MFDMYSVQCTQTCSVEGKKLCYVHLQGRLASSFITAEYSNCSEFLRFNCEFTAAILFGSTLNSMPVSAVCKMMKERKYVNIFLLFNKINQQVFLEH